MPDTMKLQIVKLNDDNYQIWKYKMELLLIKEDLWQVISEKAPVDAAQLVNWNKKDGKARAHIGLFIEDNQIIHVKSKVTAKAMWESLKEYHQKSTLSNKVRLLRRLCRMILPEGGNMMSHLNAMDECMDELATLGEPLADALAVALYLSSLSESYSVLITALESRAEEDLTKGMVKNKLLEEYKRRQDIIGVNENIERVFKTDKEFNSFNKNKFKCFFCKKGGHIKSDCRKYAAWKKKNESNNKVQNKVNLVRSYDNSDSEDAHICLLTHNKNHQNNISEWCVDSGASSHMCNDKSLFKILNKSSKSSVKVADGRNLTIKGTGAIEFKTESNKFILNDVQFIPELTCNLLSVNKLTKSGCDITFKNEKCFINKNGKNLIVVNANNNIYKAKQQAFNTIQKENLRCIHEWHKILGHRNLADVKRMEELAADLNITKCNHNEICEICIQNKKTRDPFPQESFTKTYEKLDLIHTDVCGPLQIPTPRGNKYILTLIDDYSRYCYIYLIEHKSDVKEKIIEFIEIMKTQHSKVPKIIRSDRGGEYMKNELHKYFKDNGILTQFTVPKTPQQNGVAERKNRTLIEMVRCMLNSSGIHKQYWGEAVNTANHILNRLPTKGIKATPYEIWHNKKPNLNYFQIFGTPAYVHIPKDERKKLDVTSRKLIFVGYENGTKGYRLLDVNTHKIKVSRDVTFIENQQPKVQQQTEECNTDLEDEEEIENTEEAENLAQQENLYQHEHFIQQESLIQPENSIIGSEGEFCDERKAVRWSSRENKGKPAKRLIMEINNVTEENIKDPQTYEEALQGPNSENWRKAMEEEINSLRSYGTWQITKLPPNTSAIGCKWIYKTKTDQHGNTVKFKARLVAQGFAQKFGRDYDEIFAPVANPTTLKILLTVAGQRKMKVKHFDIQTAYLNGDLSHEVFMKQPKGFVEGNNNEVCKLVKNLYGLKQGAKEWNTKFNSIMNINGYIQSTNDLCLFKKKIKNDYIYISNHVDDIVVASTNSELIDVFEKIMNRELKMKNLGNLQYYLGIQFTRDENYIFYLNQEKYILNKLKEYNLENAKDSSTPMNVGYLSQTMNQEPFESHEIYRSAIGSLLYLSTNTRPDISIATSILARRVSDPRKCDWNEVKRVFRYLKFTKSKKLKMGNHGNQDNLYGYVDADWAGDQTDRKSNTGYCLIYNGALISWASRKQSSVSLSSTEAEFIAFAEAVRDLIWIVRILKDFDQHIETPTKLFEDNQGCIKLLNDRVCHQRVKHIDIKYKFVHEHIDLKAVSAVYCPTKNMIADMLTKPLDGPKLAKHVREINLI